jgi:hypothetical protein
MSMKRTDPYKILLLKRRSIQTSRRTKRLSNFLKNQKKKKSTEQEIIEQIRHLKEQRRAFKNHFYRKEYHDQPCTIKIDGEFGLERSDIADHFFGIATQIIDCGSRDIKFDLRNCTRLWPSAVTLLCSLVQWVELSSRNSSKPPKLGSIPSTNEKVNSYLYHCGFYNYVKLGRTEDATCYSQNEVVKIQRETDRCNIETREDEIVYLLEQHTSFSKDEIELLASVILIEVFNNVVEHGVSYRDRGWWLLAQYHKKHGIISLSVADNGIGIRNTLMTGPQQAEIKKKFRNSALNDGVIIRHALQENISGAITASVKDMGFLLKKYSEGARRGNGLQRIMAACKELKVSLVLLSQNGFVKVDDTGIVDQAFPNRVFAGTLYHFTIPAKKG